MRLETERLILRKFREADLLAAQEYLGDPEVMRYLEPPFAPDQARRFIRQCGLEEPPLIYALEEKESTRLAGHVIFHPVEGEGCCELGWVLGRDFQGRGYASEISRALLRFGAERLRLRRILLEALPENAASLRLIRRLGAVPAGMADGLLLFTIPCVPGMDRQTEE